MNSQHLLRWVTVISMVLTLCAVGDQPKTGRAAALWYVAPTGDDHESCASPAAACATINAVIAKAGAGDTIYVAVGTYTGWGNRVVTLSRSVHLSGGWNADFTLQEGMSTVDGQDERGGFKVDEGVTASIERFTIERGFLYYGAGINNWGQLTVDASIIRQNGAWEWGGGIYNVGVLTITHSSLIRNSAILKGGGVANTGLLVIQASSLDSNSTSENGGGIGNTGHLRLEHSTVLGNRCSRNGGGIHNTGDLLLENSTVSSNRSGSDGGGIFNSGPLTVHSSTFTGNEAAESGGGIEQRDGPLVLQNSILSANNAPQGPECRGGLGVASYNLIGSPSDCTIETGAGNLISLAPRLGKLVGPPGMPFYLPLLSDSPAIDAGDPAGCIGAAGPLTVDQRGAPRAGRCDIGAYEYTPPGPPAAVYPFAGAFQHALPGVTYATSLEALVLDAIASPIPAAAVTFAAPATGASGTFAVAGAPITTIPTDENGIATAPAFTANSVTGMYTLTATAGAAAPALFALGNLAWHVAPGGDDQAACWDAAHPCGRIDGVLNRPDFAPGDVIRVAAGDYYGQLKITKDVTLSGGWNETFTTAAGFSTLRGGRPVILIQDAAVRVTIERFIVRDGWGTFGGGISNRGTLTLNRCIITENYATSGGGIANAGTLIVNDSTITRNIGPQIENQGPLVLNHCTVSDAIVGTNSPSGIRNYSYLTLNDTTVSNNPGRGIFSGGNLYLNNSTVAGNHGGGIYTWLYMTLSSSTVSGNHAQRGGGIAGDGWTLLRNSIIAGNTAEEGPDCWRTTVAGSAGYNLIGSLEGCRFAATEGDVFGDARLGPAEGAPAYHPLGFGSPAINAGNPAGCTDDQGVVLTTDQRGLPRVGRCDIGAYEVSLAAAKYAMRRGDVITYTVSVANLAGDRDLAPAFLTDTLPTELAYVPDSLVVNHGVGTERDGTITWQGTAAVSGPPAFSFAARVRDGVPAGTVITNTAAVTWDTLSYRAWSVATHGGPSRPLPPLPKPGLTMTQTVAAEMLPGVNREPAGSGVPTLWLPLVLCGQP